MKNFFLILISLIILSCKDTNSSRVQEEKSHMKLHEEMDKVGKELGKFNKQLVKLYSFSEKKPEKAILSADSLLLVNKQEKDKYKSQIKSNVARSLHHFKAEMLYQLGKYRESIAELETDDYKSGDIAAAYAANYVKLGEYDKAKSFVDNIGNYISDYCRGNYYECIGEKSGAIKIYNSIKQDKSIKHYAYYELAINRLEDLQKNNPKFLDEIYFPTGNPNFEICDSDNENRTKIFDLVQNLPESKGWTGTAILDYPQINDKDYYWVRVTTKNNEYNYYVYQNTFEIKFFNPKNKNLMTLNEWRRSK
ncbi:hypothetical protein PMI10_04023 [Flavobacterium sp. CF136]|nr:hypothetical protein PMI10_04023 [Flavobacterium sp. CF136]